MKATAASTMDMYIASFPEVVQHKLLQMRATIKKAAPGAEETINYAIPTFVLNGNLVHFAAFQNHIGFYPGPSGLKAFAGEIAHFKSGKGSVQFPFHQPLPLDLVRKIVSYRVTENEKKAALKKQRKKPAGQKQQPEAS